MWCSSSTAGRRPSRLAKPRSTAILIGCVGVVHHGAVDAERRVHDRLGHVVADQFRAIDLGVAVLLRAEREHAKVEVRFLLVETEHARRDRQHHHAVVERHRVELVRREDVEVAHVGEAALGTRHADEDGEKHVVGVAGHGEVVFDKTAVAATGQLVVDPAIKVQYQFAGADRTGMSADSSTARHWRWRNKLSSPPLIRIAGSPTPRRMPTHRRRCRPRR